MKLFILGIFCLFSPYGLVFAQQPVAEDPGPSQAGQVEITGNRDPDWKPYRKMLLGLDAFEKNHALAPAASLQFILRPQRPDISTAGLSLQILGENTKIELPIAPDNTFVLPRNQAAADDNADVILNRKKALFRWRPDIHSPGVPSNARRLGDLRLECEVRWAVDKFDASFLTLAFITPLGGACHSSRSLVFFTAPKRIRNVFLVTGNQREKLGTERLDPTDQISYSPPLYDHSWPDDTLLEFEFADAVE